MSTRLRVAPPAKSQSLRGDQVFLGLDAIGSEGPRQLVSQSLRGDQVFLGFGFPAVLLGQPIQGLNPSVVIRSFWGVRMSTNGQVDTKVSIPPW